MLWLSDHAREKKFRHFIAPLPKSARVLEVGCGDGWLGQRMRAGGWKQYVGLDLQPPAEIVGDVRDWRRLGLDAASFDAVIAFEVIEHAPILPACRDLLRSGGLLLLTSPHPRWDWACWLLERAGLTQRRTSPHAHLVDFRDIDGFELVSLRRYGLLAQWGVFRKPGRAA